MNAEQATANKMVLPEPVPSSKAFNNEPGTWLEMWVLFWPQEPTRKMHHTGSLFAWIGKT